MTGRRSTGDLPSSTAVPSLVPLLLQLPPSTPTALYLTELNPFFTEELPIPGLYLDASGRKRSLGLIKPLWAQGFLSGSHARSRRWPRL